VNLVLTVLEIVAPVFILGTIGFLWVRLGHDYSIRFVTQLTMTLSVPCLIFTALMGTKIEPDALAAVSLAAIVAYIAVGLLALLVVTALGLSARTYLAPLTFGNTGNLGLPLALFAFGETGLDLAVVVFAVMAVFSFTVGVWVVAGGGSLVKVVREPIVAATLLGALFLWQGWQTPRFLTNALELIGQIAIPLMLITLGVALARLRPGRIGRDLALCIGKAGLTAGIAASVGLWFALPPVPLAVLTLQVATPVAVTSYLLAEKYQADADAVAGLVVVSTMLSVIYLPLILAFVI
jgi:malate permease and related proteins